ncbi:hypothetical protein HHK36_026622 [Tetracentron sinense]|uniref:Uncharacterized protein n=1 Tax=Tetracentron sinense TaxID=13715 RepID=A0A834YJ27_TETSI|nr:hypothetical protein HHK36_026622 [Tetracentron sinense]
MQNRLVRLFLLSKQSRFHGIPGFYCAGIEDKIAAWTFLPKGGQYDELLAFSILLQLSLFRSDTCSYYRSP